MIIPNYNHAKYLDQRIQSVLNQTFQDFEMIILDDCSSDDSVEVINKYKGNPHVSHIVVNEKNSGSPFLQWKKGMELAANNLIWIAESDDYCEPSFLETIISGLEKHPESVAVQTSSCFVDESGIPMFPSRKYSGETEYLNGVEVIRQHLVCSCFYLPNASAVVFRKEVALSIPDDYMAYKSSGDRLFWIYMFERGGGLCTIQSPLNCFRQHTNKVSSRKEADGTQCRENYNINQYLHSKGYVTGIVRYQELRHYWEYIHSFPFADESIRKELVDLWFPGIWKYEIPYRIKRKVFSLL